MKSLPLVSICLPVKNGLSRNNIQKIKFKNVLDSIFEQTYSNIEIIISNNASNDKTLQFLKKYLKKKKKILSISSFQRNVLG